jgi:hypothetical protein
LCPTCIFQLEKIRKLPKKKQWNLFSYKMSCGILQKLPLLASFTKVLWWDLSYPLQCSNNFLLYGNYIALGVRSNWAYRYGNVSWGSFSFFFSFFEKHPAREQEKKKERIEVQTKDHSQKCRMHNGGALKGENMKPNTSTHHH